MARSARPAKRPVQRKARGGVRAFFAFLSRHPVSVGGSTAFLLAVSYVSANALWYQPHAHAGAFFATRERPAASPGPTEPLETTIRIERPEPAAQAAPRPAPAGDETTRLAQTLLKELRLFDGALDGVLGPNTRKAVMAFQETAGLPATGHVDAELIERLNRSMETGSVTPPPGSPVRSAPTPVAGEDADRVARIQTGLREFGNESIEVDGKAGERTRAAIREFQALFGLPETGEPDAEVHAKMVEIGLTD